MRKNIVIWSLVAIIIYLSWENHQLNILATDCNEVLKKSANTLKVCYDNMKLCSISLSQCNEAIEFENGLLEEIIHSYNK